MEAVTYFVTYFVIYFSLDVTFRVVLTDCPNCGRFRSIQTSRGQFLEVIVVEPLVWVVVIAGVVVAAQSGIGYAIVVVGAYFFVAFLALLYLRYKCEKCLATFSFNDLRGK